MTKSMRYVGAALVGFAGLALSACDTAPKDEGKQTALHAESDAAVTAFTATDPTLSALLNRAVAWVAFPEVGKAGFIVGASHGRGIVYTPGGGRVGYASLSQGSIGLQAGAQTFRELVVFMRQSDFDKFKQGEFSLGANASAVALKSGAAKSSDAGKGVIVFVESTGGLMAEAAIGGQVLKYEPMAGTSHAAASNSSTAPKSEPGNKPASGQPNW